MRTPNRSTTIDEYIQPLIAAFEAQQTGRSIDTESAFGFPDGMELRTMLAQADHYLDPAWAEEQSVSYLHALFFVAFWYGGYAALMRVNRSPSTAELLRIFRNKLSPEQQATFTHLMAYLDVVL